MNTKNAIESFLLNELLSGSRTSLDPEESLINTGLIDSLGMLRLITYLEESQGVKVGDGDVVPENFDTLNKIVAFVESHR